MCNIFSTTTRFSIKYAQLNVVWLQNINITSGCHSHLLLQSVILSQFKIDKAEAIVEHAQKVYDEAEPGSFKESCLQSLLFCQKELKV